MPISERTGKAWWIITVIAGFFIYFLWTYCKQITGREAFDILDAYLGDTMPTVIAWVLVVIASVWLWITGRSIFEHWFVKAKPERKPTLSPVERRKLEDRLKKLLERKIDEKLKGAASGTQQITMSPGGSVDLVVAHRAIKAEFGIQCANEVPGCVQPTAFNDGRKVTYYRAKLTLGGDYVIDECEAAVVAVFQDCIEEHRIGEHLPVTFEDGQPRARLVPGRPIFVDLFAILEVPTPEGRQVILPTINFKIPNSEAVKKAIEFPKGHQYQIEFLLTGNGMSQARAMFQLDWQGIWNQSGIAIFIPKPPEPAK